MANRILVTGAAGRVGAVGRTVTKLLLQQGKVVRAMVRSFTYDCRSARARLRRWQRRTLRVWSPRCSPIRNRTLGRSIT